MGCEADGWFGGRWAATLRRLVAGLMTMPLDPRVACVPVGLWLLANAIGLRLWRENRGSSWRDRLCLARVGAACGARFGSRSRAIQARTV